MSTIHYDRDRGHTAITCKHCGTERQIAPTRADASEAYIRVERVAASDAGEPAETTAEYYCSGDCAAEAMRDA